MKKLKFLLYSLVLLMVVCILGPAKTASAGYWKDNFNFVGSSAESSNTTVRMIPFQQTNRGAIWNKKTKIDFSKSFTMEADVALYNPTSLYADGITWTFHNDPRGLEAIGDFGSGIGAYVGNETHGSEEENRYVKNAISVELDPYPNPSSYDSIAGGHIALHRPGKNADMVKQFKGYNGTAPKRIANGINSSTFRVWTFKWNASTKVLTSKFGGTTITSTSTNIYSLLGNSYTAYWGFTSSSGQGAGVFEVKNLRGVPAGDSYDKVDYTKSVDKIFAQVGETLTYTIKLKNNNTVPIGNLKLTDVIDTTKLDYQAGSIVINGKNQTDNLDTDQGQYTAGTLTALTDKIAAGKEATISFKAKVKVLNVGTFISNQATVEDLGTLVGTKKTTIALTRVVVPPATMDLVSAVKSVDKTTAEPGEILTYTIKVKNNNATTVGGFNVRDILDANVVDYQENSVTLNNVSLTDSINDSDAGEAYNNTINVKTTPLVSGEEAIITFKAKVKATVPNATIISNQASVVDIGSNLGTKETNRVNVSVNVVEKPTIALIDAIKTVDKVEAQPGEILTYTIKVKNNNATTVGGFRIQDILDSTLVEYQENSLTLSGQPLTDAVDTDTGQFRNNTISVLTNTLKQDEEVTITFKVKVKDTVPNNTIISNQGTIYDMGTDLGAKSTNPVDVTVKVVEQPKFEQVDAVKSVDKVEAQPGEELTYTIKVKNNNSVAVGGFKIQDILDPTLVNYQANSLTLNGKSLTDAPDADSGQFRNNIVSGLTNSLAPNEEATFTFKVNVKDTVPNNTIVSNQGTIYDMGTDLGAKSTNPVDVTVKVVEKPELALIDTVKSVNKANAMPGDILTYTIKVKNNNTVEAGGFTVTDIVDSANVEYQVDSTTVDGVSYTDAQDGDRVSFVKNKLTAGIKDALAPNQEAVITFKVKVKADAVENTVIKNKANVLDRTGLGEKETNEVTTKVDMKAPKTVTIYLRYYMDYFDGNGDTFYKEVPFEVEIGSTFVVKDHILDFGSSEFDYASPSADFVVQDTGARQEVNYYYFMEYNY